MFVDDDRAVCMMYVRQSSVFVDDDWAVCMMQYKVTDAAQDGAPDQPHPARPHHYHVCLLLISNFTDVLPWMAKLWFQYVTHLFVQVFQFRYTYCAVSVHQYIWLLQCTLKFGLYVKQNGKKKII